MGTFLFGNLRDSDLVLAAVLPQLGSERQVQVQLAAERIPRACRVAPQVNFDWKKKSSSALLAT